MALLKGVDLNRVAPTMPQPGPPTPKNVSITVEEYAQLLRDSAELVRLRAALQPAATHEAQGMLIKTLNLVSNYTTLAKVRTTAELAETNLGIDDDLDDSDRFDMESFASLLEETGANVTQGLEEDFEPREHANHTIILLSPIPLTHAQVATAVRGGALLQIFTQRFRCQVNVTFARAEDAATFLEYAQSAPFYVGGHLTTARWAPRSYIAPKYVFHLAHAGTVSRNLVLEKVKPKVTEAIIRENLHHIHNMAVISVKFEQGNAYISTSSVGGALFARTCMRSRAFYKNMRISFYEDECAKSPPRVRARRSRAAAPPVKPPKKKQGPVYNPYEVLSQDEEEVQGWTPV